MSVQGNIYHFQIDGLRFDVQTAKNDVCDQLQNLGKNKEVKTDRIPVKTMQD